VYSYLWQKGVQEVPAGVLLGGRGARGVSSVLLPSRPHWGIDNAANHQHPSLSLAAEQSATLQTWSILLCFAWHNLLQDTLDTSRQITGSNCKLADATLALIIKTIIIIIFTLSR